MAVKKKEENVAVDMKKKNGSKLKWVLLAILLAALAGGGGAAYWFLMAPKDSHEETDPELAAPTPATPERLTREIVTLSPFIVNLADPLGRRFLRLTLDVEVAGREAANDLNRLESRVRDSIILLLSSKAYADLASMESKIILKKEIVDRLNQIIGEARVSNVYFTEFVIQ